MQPQLMGKPVWTKSSCRSSDTIKANVTDVNVTAASNFIGKSKTTPRFFKRVYDYKNLEIDTLGYVSIRKLEPSLLWRENFKFRADKLESERREEMLRIAEPRNKYHRPSAAKREISQFNRSELVEVFPIIMGSSSPNAPAFKIEQIKFKPVRNIFSFDFVIDALNKEGLHFIRSSVLHYWNNLKMKKGYGKCNRTIEWCNKTFSKFETPIQRYDSVTKKVEFLFSSKKKLHRKSVAEIRRGKEIIQEGNVPPAMRVARDSAQVKIDIGLTIKSPLDKLYEAVVRWMTDILGLKDVEHLITLSDVTNMIILLNAEDGTVIAQAAWIQFLTGGIYKLCLANLIDLPGTVMDIFRVMVGSEPRFMGTRPSQDNRFDKFQAMYRARAHVASMGFVPVERSENFSNSHWDWESQNHPGPVDAIMTAVRWQYDVDPHDKILHPRDIMLIRRLQIIARYSEMDPRAENYYQMRAMQRSVNNIEINAIEVVDADHDYYSNLSTPRVVAVLRVLTWLKSLPVHVRAENDFMMYTGFLIEFMDKDVDNMDPNFGNEFRDVGPGVSGNDDVQEGKVSEVLELARWLVGRVKNAPLVVKVISFLSFMVSSTIFDSIGDRMQFLLKALGILTGLMKEGADGVSIFFDFAADMARGFEEYMDGTSFGAAFFKVGASEQMIKDITTMKIELGNIRSNPKVDPRAVLLRAEMLITKKSLIDSKDPLVISGRREIEEMRFNIMSSLNVQRLQPAGVIITGPPGCGKSYLISEFGRSLKKRTGIPMDVNNTHVHTGTKHQTLPACVQQYVVNDAFQTKDEYLEMSMMDLMQVMVDITPMKPETASISEKNMSYIAPMLSTITTNMKKFVMSKATGGANKMDRRYLVIEVVYSHQLMAAFNGDVEAIRLKLDGTPWKQENFEYVVGRMANKDNNTLLVFPARDFSYHKSLASVAKVVMAEVDRRFNSPDVEVLDTCDKCGVCRTEICLCGIYVCPCGYQLEPEIECPKGHSLAWKQDRCNLCDEKPCICMPPVPPPNDLDKKFFKCRKCRKVECACLVAEGKSLGFLYPKKVALILRRKCCVCCKRRTCICSPSGFLPPVLTRKFKCEACRQYQCTCLVAEGVEVVSVETILTGFMVFSIIMMLVYVVSMRGPVVVEHRMQVPIFVDESNGVKWSKLQTIVKIVLGLAALKLVYVTLFKSGSKLVKSEGAMITRLHDVPKEQKYVRPFLVRASPWINSESTTFSFTANCGSMTTQGFMLTHELALLPLHLFSTGGEKLTISTGNMSLSFKVNESMMWTKGNHSDMRICFLPGVPAVYDPAYVYLTGEYCLPEGKVTLGKYEVSDVREHVLRVGKGFSYNLESDTNGCCGLPLRGGNGAIVGFHVGRSKYEPNLKRAESLTRKDVDAASIFFKSKGVIVNLNAEDLPQSVETLVREANFSHFLNEHSDVAKYGKFEGSIEASDHIPLGSLRHRDNSKMSARPSKLHEIFGERCPPMGKPFNGKAIEWEGKWVSPALYRIRACIKKSCTDPHFAMFAIENMIGDIPVPVQKLEPLDFYRAVCGDPENSLMNPRDSTKSVGFTLQKMGVTPESAFTRCGDTWKPHVKVVNEFNRLESIVKGDEPLPLSVYSATLKDEVYPLEKVAKGKGRYFYVGDLAMNLLARKYLLPLTTYLMEMIKESCVVVTMNAGSAAWKSMYEHHLRISDKAFFNDQKEMDLHQSAFMSYYNSYMYALALRCGYTKEDARIATRIISMANRFVLIMENNFYIVHTTLCSGRWDTIIVNCLSGHWLTTRAILKKLGRIPKLVISPIWDGRIDTQHTSLKDKMAGSYCGDDSIVSVNPRIGLTGEEFKVYCAEEGYLLTSSDHTESVEEMPLKDGSFLKRGFGWRGEDVLAPLEKKSIWKSLAYVCGVPLEREDERNRGTSIAAVREMFMHGPEDFENLRNELSNIFPDIIYPTYDEIVKERELGVFQSWQTTYATRKDYDQKRGGEAVTNVSVCADSGRASPGRLSLDSRVQTVDSSNETNDELIQESFTELNSSEPLVTQTTNTPVTEIGVISQLADTYASVISDFRVPHADVDLKQFFARPRALANFDSDNFENVLAFSDWFGLSPVQKVLEQYTHFRGDLRVKLVFTGSTAYFGKWRLWAYPRKKTGDYNPLPMTLPFLGGEPNSFTTTSQLPHVDVDVSQVGTYELNLPFPFPYRFMEISDSEYDWAICWTEINPVTAISGLTPLRMSGELYVSYHNVELDVLVPEGETTPGMVSSILQYGSRIASRINAPWANPLMHGLEFGASVAKFFGFSRPPVVQSTMVVNRHYGDVAYASGMPDFSHGMTVDPAVMRNVVGNYFPLSSPGETTFSSLVNRKSQLVANWAEDAPVVCIPTNEFTTLGRYYPTSISFATKMFEWWTGDLEMCVEVISSPLIRWRIGIAIVPPGLPVPLTFPTNGSYLTTVIDVTGTTCTDITIPYLYLEPFRATKGTINDTMMVYYSLNDPIGPSATPVYPTLNVWIKAGENFSVGIPTTEHIDDIVLEGKDSGLGKASEMVFGEIIDDLLLLSRRASYVYGMNFLGGDIKLPIQPLVPNGVSSEPPFINTQLYMSFGTYLSTAYLGESGGWCYKIIHQYYPDAVKEFTTGRQLLTGPVEEGSTGKGAVLLDAKEEKIMEIRVPDRNIRTFRYTGSVYSNTSVYETLAMTTFQDTDSEVATVVYMSNADDYKVGGFLCAPPYTLRV